MKRTELNEYRSVQPQERSLPVRIFVQDVLSDPVAVLQSALMKHVLGMITVRPREGSSNVWIKETAYFSFSCHIR